MQNATNVILIELSIVSYRIFSGECTGVIKFLEKIIISRALLSIWKSISLPVEQIYDILV